MQIFRIVSRSSSVYLATAVAGAGAGALRVRLVPRTYLYLVIVQLHLLSRAIQHLHESSNLSGYETGRRLALDILLCI